MKVITIIQKLYDESDNSVRIDGVTTAGSGWWREFAKGAFYRTAVCNCDELCSMQEWEDHLCDLDFADGIALIANSLSSMQQTTTALTMEAGKVGLCTNPKKWKVLTTPVWSDRTAAGSDIEKVDDFCYLDI